MHKHIIELLQKAHLCPQLNVWLIYAITINKKLIHAIILTMVWQNHFDTWQIIIQPHHQVF